MNQSWNYKPALTALNGVFLKLQPQTWMSSQIMCHHISVSVRICASLLRHLYHSIMINHGLQENSDSFFMPKRMLTEVGIKHCTTRPGTLTKEIRVAKRSYSEKQKKQFSAKDPASVWKGLKSIIKNKTPPPRSVESQLMADELNVFYCRFEKPSLTPLPHSDLHFTHTHTGTPPHATQSALMICEEDVCQVFQKQKTRKASSPDGVSPACLKVCVGDQLAVWCGHNNLEFNTLKTVEMTVYFMRNPPSLPPSPILNSTGVIQVPGLYHLSGPKVGHPHRLHCEEGSAEVVLPSPAEEVKPVTGAAETVLLGRH
ncbi:uncharacterized protein LOC127447661 [Myxocyprinus asiaticus]|uniref:uncharacterized protein LOC127447661 n=1 Tax=Myxocyprinus asiaticus TaxID=70543 RepID=UPI00222152F6|nr:uncharacterized protein LOC127447661 [Myxocyprinus asiaticus]XP_051565599.1 uncharacterized protein LOC127447661 [Myxocyprinus asiaticus]XP_051565600.1 uncharacterized protein LOC127447661 [Myxocyprinus asiaticus]